MRAALDQLEALYKGVLARFDVSLYFDLAELRGYQYHTGMMFAAYVPGYGHALAKGGVMMTLAVLLGVRVRRPVFLWI